MKNIREPSPNLTARFVRDTATTMWRIMAGLVLAALLTSGVIAQTGRLDVGGKPSVQTMTANLYIGAGVERVLALDPTDPGYVTNLIVGVTEVYHEVIDSQPAVRLQAVADAIAARRPHLVAVQEASLIRNQSPGDLLVGGTMPATNVVFDYLHCCWTPWKRVGRIMRWRPCSRNGMSRCPCSIS